MTAAAAVLALLISALALFRPDTNANTTAPFFVIRAHAADGSISNLGNAGDVINLKAGTSDIFPGKKTYTLDVSLEGCSGDPAEFSEGDFFFLHSGALIEPGESDEALAIEWLTMENDGICGYRITGWCEESDIIDITIRNVDNEVIHRTRLAVNNEAGYRAVIQIAYSYQTGLTTDELIDQILRQNYSTELMLNSSPYAAYSAIRNLNGGFMELEERPDAASKLLERYVSEMEERDILPDTAFIMGNDYIVGLMLSQDVYWDQLTQEEKELFASYGVWRDLDDEGQKGIFEIEFPGKEIFRYELRIPKEKWSYCHSLEVTYDGKTVSSDDEHFIIFHIGTASWAEEQYAGWAICGWFDESTEVTLTVTGDNGELIREDVILVTPTEDGYQIDLLETTG